MTTLQLGWTNPLTGAFGAHPSLGGPLNLNDGATWTLTSPAGLELPLPPRTLVPVGNVRTRGQRASRAIYRQNREARCQLILGPMATYANLVSTIRGLLAWVDGPPQVPVTIQYQPPQATSPVYLDVVGAAADVPSDEDQWLTLQLEPITLVFWCRPGLRGDRVVLSNLAWNPGFEAPGPPWGPDFSDPMTSFNAYAVQAGGALAQETARYTDAVQADNPTHFFRLDETSGTTAYNATFNPSATTHGSPTQGVAGLLAGDSDPCYTLASASSQYLSLNSASGAPSGNAPLTLEAWVKLAANPSANAFVWGYGNTATSKGCIQLYVDTSGKPNVNFGPSSATITGASALSLNTPHHLVVTWDGTTATLYVDGMAVGTATPGSLSIAAASGNFNLGAAGGTPGSYWNGQLDEAAVYATALSAARVSAHYSAGHNAPSGGLANSMVVPAGGRVAFGSPNWGAVQQWALRLRYNPGATVTAYLHYTDASDYLAAVLTESAPGAASLTLNQVVGG